MKSTILIGKERFTVNKTQFVPHVMEWNLYGCYTEPSQTKIAIWEYWRKWFSENHQGDYDYIAISSYNTMMFTICGKITVGGVEYTYYITKTRQELYRV